MTGVSPESSAAFGLAPAASSRRTIGSLPFRLAVQSGVTPRSFAAFDAGAAPNQQVGAFDIVAVARPMQRGRAVGFGRVDVGAFWISARSASRLPFLAASTSGGDHRRRPSGRSAEHVNRT